MQTEAERIFYRRLYILIGLTAAIVCGLFYLVYKTQLVPSENNREDLLFIKVPKEDNILIYNDNQIVLVPAGETAAEHAGAGGQSGTDTQPSEPDTESSHVKADTMSETSDVRIVSPAALIRADYVPDGMRVPDVPMYQTQQLRRDAADALEDMFSAAKDDGFDLYLISGYRSYRDQQELWDYYEDYYGPEYTSHLDAHPGGSEHQLGLAVDIGTTDNVCRLDTCFGDTGAFAWLQGNSWKYGYIERYPQGKEDVTGIMYSPWGFRYTGKTEAEKIYASGMTMEEYYETH